jgi:hypothetical protein
MIIVSDTSKTLDDGIEQNLNFNFEQKEDGKVLFHGYKIWENQELINKHKLHRRYLLDLWSPTSLCSTEAKFFEEHKAFDKVFCICPYTCEYVNELIGEKKYFYIPYPYEYQNSPVINDKFYDVCYFGSLPSPLHVDCIASISKLNYRFLSLQSYPQVTDFRVPYHQKLEIVSKCKISVCYNFFVEIYPQKVIQNPNWMKHGAFTRLGLTGTIPQFKARIHEAVICQTLILCKRDSWNLIEDYYKPNVHFLYFDDNIELTSLINIICKNWDYFSNLPQQAYEHYKNNFTTSAILTRIENE